MTCSSVFIKKFSLVGAFIFLTSCGNNKFFTEAQNNRSTASNRQGAVNREAIVSGDFQFQTRQAKLLPLKFSNLEVGSKIEVYNQTLDKTETLKVETRDFSDPQLYANLIENFGYGENIIQIQFAEEKIQSLVLVRDFDIFSANALIGKSNANYQGWVNFYGGSINATKTRNFQAGMNHIIN